MVKVSIGVRFEAARFDATVRAKSIQRAMSIMQEHYSKGSLKVKSPIESESFFVEDPTAPRRIELALRIRQG
jgi:hypothetical protein